MLVTATAIVLWPSNCPNISIYCSIQIIIIVNQFNKYRCIHHLVTTKSRRCQAFEQLWRSHVIKSGSIYPCHTKYWVWSSLIIRDLADKAHLGKSKFICQYHQTPFYSSASPDDTFNQVPGDCKTKVDVTQSVLFSVSVRSRQIHFRLDKRTQENSPAKLKKWTQ